jgi:PAS domain S-box-containing protein
MRHAARILVADDDPDILLLFTTLLLDEGYEVYEAATGKGCLDAARSHHPELVLLDVVLPDMAGIEVCRQIKADPELHATFVILVSGARVSSEEQAGGLDAGADDYIVKGATNREFLARIRSLVHIKRAEDALRKKEEERRKLISALRKALAESRHGLLRYEEHYRAYAGLGGHLAWVANADEEAGEDLPFWRRHISQSHEETKNWGWLNAVHPDDIERVRETWTQALMTGTPSEAEFRLRRHDGAYRHFLGLAVPLFGNDGGIREWVGACVDVTERKQAEEELARRTAELKAIFAAQNDVVLVYDADMNVCQANQAFFAVYGFDPLGLNVREIAQRVSCRWLNGKPFVWEEQPARRALRGEKATAARFLITRADGTERVVETLSGSMLVGGCGAGSVTVWHDVTERQRAEEALLRVRFQIEDRMQEMAENFRRILDDPERAKIDPDARALTTRETEVLTLIAESTSRKTIANRLHISVHTVTRHRANIMRKLKAGKTADLMKYAISHGLVVR